ncbi:hypothetical protein BM221_007391 [Beauveria bassiana]|uniref:Cytochrome b561 domain-containing protein n=1 Tax=Beauveria bassiana TaxID=176275 RepID=A0A2N6NGK4_BEABA|nr:hypothetical protein BM221_007391 [Beauveria bassiana]
MAPTPDELSAPGSASYASDTMNVGDGTWVFDKNTFLLPNLQGVNFDTMRYNGMGNRFSTFVGYHSIILAHAVMAALVFLLIVPFSVMTIRFYDRNPGRAVVYHGQLQVLASLMLLVIFILGFFAVGPSRNLSNPHHGIGVAIFVLFILQLVGGRLVRNISKSRSLRIMIHQWSGRAIGLLGIVQVPLGLTLYGSPKYLFILYALWMAFLFLLYFILSYRRAGHRDYYMGGGARSDGGTTRLTESEYHSDHKPNHNSKLKWLGPLAAGAGLWALLRNRNKKQDRERSRSPSSYRTRTDAHSGYYSHDQSERFYDDKYSEPPQRKSSGGGFLKMLGGVAAAVGAGGLAANLMKKRNNRDEEYSAVSTETPRRHRSGRGARSDYSSEYTDYTPTQTSLLPPSAKPANTYTTRTGTTRTDDTGRPTTPYSSVPPRRDYDDSEYSSYVSPSHRRPPENSGGGGLGKGILGGLGMGWIAKKLADRHNKKQEDRLREEEDMRAGTSVSRFTGDGYPSPTRRDSRRPPPIRRPTGYGPPHGTETAFSEVTESSIDHPPRVGARSGSIQPVPMPSQPPRSGGRHDSELASMPPMPADPHGILHSGPETSFVSGDASPPQRRPSERRRRAGERAAAAAAARAGNLAANEGRGHRGDRDLDRDRYASPSSQPVSVKVKVHDDRDRNVTLRRLTDEEAMATRGRRDSESSISEIESPSNGRGYRRAAANSRAAAEREAERRVEEEDKLAPLSPPRPAFAKGRRGGKDSAYYSGGAAGPGGSTAAHGQTVSSLGSQGTHGTWSGMSGVPSPGDGGGDGASESAAADNRRRRRMERRRGSSAARPPAGADMFN